MFHKTQEEIMQNWNTSTNKPLCSFLCVTYNHKDFISQALNSMLEQETNFPFEIIIIHDDCSLDGTDTIIKAYGAKYPKIIKALYETQNQYSQKEEGHNFWATMHKMAGKYIALCEGDDYWNDSSKIQTQVDFLESNKDYVLCYHDCEIIDSNNNHVQSQYFKQDASGSMMQKIEIGFPTRCVCYRNVIDFCEPNLVYFMPKIFNGDTFLWILLGEYGKAKYLPQIKAATYRLHQGGVWSSLNENEQYQIHTKSFFYIAKYFYSKGNATLYNHFLILALNNMLQADKIILSSNDFSKISKILLNHTSRTMGGGYLLRLFLLLSSQKSIFFSNRQEIGLENGEENMPHNGFRKIYPTLYSIYTQIYQQKSSLYCFCK